MQLVVAALLPFGRGVGNGFSSSLPANLVAPPLQQGDEIRRGSCCLHSRINGTHQPELPALALFRRPEFTGADCLCLRFLLVGLQRCQAHVTADAVGNMPQPFQSVRVLPQLFAVSEAHGVDHQVRMNMFRVAVGGNKNFKALIVLGQLQRRLVCLRRRDIFLWREALRVVVEENSFGFAVGILCCYEFRIGRFRTTVLPRDEFHAVADALFVLPDVVQYTLQRASALASAANKVYRRHQLRSPVRARILSSTAAKSCLTSSSRRLVIRPMLHRVVS